jgi:hypothetical protein
MINLLFTLAQSLSGDGSFLFLYYTSPVQKLHPLCPILVYHFIVSCESICLKWTGAFFQAQGPNVCLFVSARLGVKKEKIPGKTANDGGQDCKRFAAFISEKA